MAPRISLEASLSTQGAHVVRSVGPDGHTLGARFDLEALPRVDAALTGMPVSQVPRVVERLCGICPVAHHLAGLGALEALHGVQRLPKAARFTRRLLHHGSAVDQLALRLVHLDVRACMALRKVGRAAMAAAGSPGHFPTTGTPGGVLHPVDPACLAPLRDQARQALEVAASLLEQARGQSGAMEAFAGPQVGHGEADGAFDGLEVCLVNGDGSPDLLGERLRAVTPTGQVAVPGAGAHQWPTLVTESCPGQVAPRPLLHAPGASGPGRPYRVGPVSQLRVGALTTPLAGAQQERWLRDEPDIVVARVVMLLHALEVVAELADQPQAFAGPLVLDELPACRQGTGTGWVESPRGLLVHSYRADGAGLLAAAQILTPTAQNEPWLAALLARAGTSQARMEQAIQEADPCLPCVSAPQGMMDLTVTTVETGV